MQTKPKISNSCNWVFKKELTCSEKAVLLIHKLKSAALAITVVYS